jgi:GDSL-like Lipase/Acylhydrolase family
MNLARISIAVIVIGALTASYSFLRKDAIIDSHRRARQVMLHYTLSRVEQPIIVLGDSITEASTLPRTLCDHAIVNAGLDGASVSASDLGSWLKDVLNGRRAAAILIALGTNDALQGREQAVFETSYAALLAQLAGSTDHLAVLGIPAVEARGYITAEYQAETMSRIVAFNAALPALAEKGGATFVALPPVGAPQTIDGVHLNAAGSAVWDAAVLKGVSGACNAR